MTDFLWVDLSWAGGGVSRQETPFGWVVMYVFPSGKAVWLGCNEFVFRQENCRGARAYALKCAKNPPRRWGKVFVPVRKSRLIGL